MIDMKKSPSVPWVPAVYARYSSDNQEPRHDRYRDHGHAPRLRHRLHRCRGFRPFTPANYIRNRAPTTKNLTGRSRRSGISRLCREFPERDGHKVADTYTDYAISSSSDGHRPGRQSLIEDAKERRFDAVCAEALDRLSRD